MQHRTPLDDDRLHVVEVIGSLAGEDADVQATLEGIQPGMIALDVAPETLQQLVAHAKHGLGVEVPHLEEAWTNCLAAFAQVDPYAPQAAAVEHGIEREIPLAALNRDATDLRKGQKRRLAKSLSEQPIEAEDVREVAMAFRGRLHELGLIDRIEDREERMAETLTDLIRRGTRVAAVLSYPTSEEIVVRVRDRLAEAGFQEPETTE